MIDRARVTVSVQFTHCSMVAGDDGNCMSACWRSTVLFACTQCCTHCCAGTDCKGLVGVVSCQISVLPACTRCGITSAVGCVCVWQLSVLAVNRQLFTEDGVGNWTHDAADADTAKDDLWRQTYWVPAAAASTHVDNTLSRCCHDHISSDMSLRPSNQPTTMSSVCYTDMSWVNVPVGNMACQLRDLLLFITGLQQQQ